MSEVFSEIVENIKHEKIELVCDLVSKEISCQTFTFLQFVESLEELLTSSDKNIRLNGLKAFVAVISKMPLDFFKSDELDFIYKFLCERFIDHHSFVPTILIGIKNTIKMTHIKKEMIIRFFNVIMPHFHCQSQLQKDRNIFFHILHYVFINHLNDIHFLGPDFVYCVISSIDGERDPSNLSLLFKILPQFFCNYPLGHLAEEAFDVIACYFPIDFRENKESKINRIDLALNLARCLTCVEDFACFSILLALEKLEASQEVAKLDSLHLLKLCCENFSSKIIKEHMEEIWRILKFIIMSDTDDTSDVVREAAISVLTALLYSLAIIKGQDNEEQLLNFIDIILKSSDRFLSNAQTTLFIPSIKLLCNVGITSKYACRRIAEKIYFMFLDKSNLSPSEVPQILQALSLITNMCIQMEIELHSIPGLETRWEEICCLFLLYSHSEVNEIKISSLKALRISIKTLSKSQRQNYYNTIIDLIKSKTTKEVTNEMLNGFKEIAKYYNEEVMTFIINSNIGDFNESSDIYLKSKYLKTLCSLINEKYFYPIINEKLCKYIGCNQEVTKIALKYLRELCENSESDNLLSYFSVDNGIMNHLFMFWINEISNCNCNELQLNETFLNDTSFIINCIMCTLSSSDQFQIITKYNQYFDDIQNSSIIYEELTADKQKKFSYLIVLLESLLNSLNPCIEIKNITLIVKNCIEMAINTKLSICALSASRLTATLINKYFNGDEYDVHLDKYKLKLEGIIKFPNTNKQYVINQMAWITKALTLKGHNKMLIWVDWLVNLLADPEYGKIATTGFLLLTQTDNQYLSTTCFCSIKLLYKQRFFCYVIEPLISLYNKSSEPIKENYLTSILYQMNGSSYTSISPYFTEILPILLQILCPEQTHVLQSLHIFCRLLESKAYILEDYLQSFVPKLLFLSHNSKLMMIRIRALQCLYHCCDFSLIKLLPLKKKVIFELAKCLDDKKRLVRKEAVKTKFRWINIDSLKDTN
ncbi:MMS19 nucleotide excision repair protein homolog [Daktulosphaira vitifoliae]|uniref:MMS19 nucleotide excision repair protein homolog n=1 Tax=Daktulosphaira vitifoliae TaxID=58002 RepID=UPI0021AA9F2D|nr:MMS19 nucleotide excision repair protein homolog [Daktulosphaira vitifoliae]